MINLIFHQSQCHTLLVVAKILLDSIETPDMDTLTNDIQAPVVRVDEPVVPAIKPAAEGKFFPAGAIAFFVLLVILSLVFWYGIYFLMIKRS